LRLKLLVLSMLSRIHDAQMLSKKVCLQPSASPIEDELCTVSYVKPLLTLGTESAGRSDGTVVYELFEGELEYGRRSSRGGQEV
jgi:hypothetical protein